MGISNIVPNLKRLKRVISKPNRKEAWLLIKVSTLGVTALGVIGFMIKALFWIIGLSPTPSG